MQFDFFLELRIRIINNFIHVSLDRLKFFHFACKILSFVVRFVT